MDASEIKIHFHLIAVTLFLQQWGWYIVFGVIAVLFLKSKFEPQLEAMRKRRQEQDYARFGK